MNTGAYGVAAEFARREYGGHFAPDVDTFSVQDSARQALEPDPECVSLLLMNLGDSAVFVSPVPGVGTSNGIRLAPEGGSISFNIRDDAVMPTLPYYAVSGTAGQTLLIVRVRRVAVSQKEG